MSEFGVSARIRARGSFVGRRRLPLVTCARETRLATRKRRLTGLTKLNFHTQHCRGHWFSVRCGITPGDVRLGFRSSAATTPSDHIVGMLCRQSHDALRVCGMFFAGRRTSENTHCAFIASSRKILREVYVLYSFYKAMMVAAQTRGRGGADTPRMRNVLEIKI